MIPPDIFSRLEKSLRLAGSGSDWIFMEPVEAKVREEIKRNLEQYGIAIGRKELPISAGLSGTKRPIQTKSERSAVAKEKLPERPRRQERTSPSKYFDVPRNRNLSPLDATNLDSLRLRIRDCLNCSLCRERKTVVFGQGNQNAQALFIGDYPEEEDDRKGTAAIGRAGKLLTQIIQSIGISRDSVYITSVLKCHPPGGYRVGQAEVSACLPILLKQIALLQPHVIVTLGNLATKALLPEAKGIGEMRGKQLAYRKIPVVPTYHPAYLLKNFSVANRVWDDIRRVRQLLFAKTFS